MAEWECVKEIKVIRCGTSIEREQKEALGYGGRTIETLRCSKCHKVRFVDKSIRYDYCPHCGAKMKQYWEPQYPSWEEWLVANGIMEPDDVRVNGDYRFYYNGKPVYNIPSPKMFDPIPADMAEKLGIEPKEVNRGT